MALSTSRQNGVLLVALLLGQLLLMSGSARGAEGSTLLESWSMRLSAPFLAAGRVVGGGWGGILGGAADLLLARARNELLQDELHRLRAEVARQREAEQENYRLRRLLAMREELVPRSIAASVVTSTLDGHTRTIVVDRGELDGVKLDQAVVAWGGAVGRVVAVDRRHAKVWLLSDPNSGVAGLVQRSRANGMVFGTGPGPLELRYVPSYADVMHGDRVVTSGIDGIFPRGFGLGRVTSIKEGIDGIQTILLEPELDCATLEEVLIVLEQSPRIEDRP
jgi:rod shape-determining protein MreC